VSTSRVAKRGGLSEVSGGEGDHARGPDDTWHSLVLETKLRPPSLGRGHVPRRRLIDSLIASSDRRLVLLDAPVGYGKTMLLSEWRASSAENRPFAWVSIDPEDADPGRLLAHVVEALRRSFPGFGDSVIPALQVQGAYLEDDVAPRIINELAKLEGPAVLLLDDYHALRGDRIHEIVTFLMDHLPATVQLAVATRADPPLPLSRLRASGGLLELRAADLRFDDEEASALMSASSVRLDGIHLQELLDRTEGWPAGLYLAALTLRGHEDPQSFVRRFAGTNRHVADYLTEEVLGRETEEVRTFLTRTSILDRLCSGLCDEVLQSEGSQEIIEELEHSNLFIVPLDDRRQWYRYHHLFQDMLRADLARTDADRAPELHGRASAWFEAHDLPEEAFRHAIAGTDHPRAGRLISRHWRSLTTAGRAETVNRWLEELGDDAVAADPVVALAAAWMALVSGQPDRVERWLAVVEAGSVSGPLPDGTVSLESGALLIRGLYGFRGLRQMRASLLRASELESDASSPWRAVIATGLGVAAYFASDLSEARDQLREAVGSAPPSDPMLLILALGELSLVEGELGDDDAAQALALQAQRIAEERGLTRDPGNSFTLLALGQSAANRGELAGARNQLEQALELRKRAGRLSPMPGVQILLALASVSFGLGDADEARKLVNEARLLVESLDDAGELTRRVEDQERALRSTAHRLEFGQELTDRELGVLRLLPTRLTQREIGRELYLSLNTVKSHTRAIYRKLAVSSRSEAVSKARQINIL
jgi:LuxR family transcriptional regulator, maltose regulon positive regulatory protein